MNKRFETRQLPAMAFDWGTNNGVLGFLNGLVGLLEALIVPFTLIIQLFTSIFGGGPEEEAEESGGE